MIIKRVHCITNQNVLGMDAFTLGLFQWYHDHLIQTHFDPKNWEWSWKSRTFKEVEVQMWLDGFKNIFDYHTFPARFEIVFHSLVVNVLFWCCFQFISLNYFVLVLVIAFKPKSKITTFNTFIINPMYSIQTQAHLNTRKLNT